VREVKDGENENAKGGLQPEHRFISTGLRHRWRLRWHSLFLMTHMSGLIPAVNARRPHHIQVCRIGHPCFMLLSLPRGRFPSRPLSLYCWSRPSLLRSLSQWSSHTIAHALQAAPNRRGCESPLAHPGSLGRALGPVYSTGNTAATWLCHLARSHFLCPRNSTAVAPIVTLWPTRGAISIHINRLRRCCLDVTSRHA
jgi:hypothetical protein